jgi:hypothetical protein
MGPQAPDQFPNKPVLSLGIQPPRIEVDVSRIELDHRRFPIYLVSKAIATRQRCAFDEQSLKGPRAPSFLAVCFLDDDELPMDGSIGSNVLEHYDVSVKDADVNHRITKKLRGAKFPTVYSVGADVSITDSAEKPGTQFEMLTDRVLRWWEEWTAGYSGTMEGHIQVTVPVVDLVLNHEWSLVATTIIGREIPGSKV